MGRTYRSVLYVLWHRRGPQGARDSLSLSGAVRVIATLLLMARQHRHHVDRCELLDRQTFVVCPAWPTLITTSHTARWHVPHVGGAHRFLPTAGRLLRHVSHVYRCSGRPGFALLPGLRETWFRAWPSAPCFPSRGTVATFATFGAAGETGRPGRALASVARETARSAVWNTSVVLGYCGIKAIATAAEQITSLQHCRTSSLPYAQARRNRNRLG